MGVQRLEKMNIERHLILKVIIISIIYYKKNTLGIKL